MSILGAKRRNAVIDPMYIPASLGPDKAIVHRVDNGHLSFFVCPERPCHNGSLSSGLCCYSAYILCPFALEPLFGFIVCSHHMAVYVGLDFTPAKLYESKHHRSSSIKRKIKLHLPLSLSLSLFVTRGTASRTLFCFSWMAMSTVNRSL